LVMRPIGRRKHCFQAEEGYPLSRLQWAAADQIAKDAYHIPHSVAISKIYKTAIW
jgi:hypothetical protein